VKQLVVASEYGEPSNHVGVICQRLCDIKKDVCLLLITKNLPDCSKIIVVADSLSIPYQIHCTITGLGGTVLEPQVPAPNLMVEESIKVIEKYKIDPKAITVRIDPIVPEFLDLQTIEASHTLKAFAGIGVKDCRISIVDYYPHVRERFDKLGIKHPDRFQVGIPLKNLIIDRMFHLTSMYNMKLHLCAEYLGPNLEGSIYPGVDTEGCASAASWKRLGITDLKPATRKQREECTCNLSKQDLLAGLSKGCKGGCVYCYWR